MIVEFLFKELTALVEFSKLLLGSKSCPGLPV